MSAVSPPLGLACGKRELAKSGRIGDHVDLGDPPVFDGQAQGGEQSSAWCDDDSWRPVHERYLGGPGLVGEHPGLVGHRTGAADLGLGVGRHREAIGSANHIGREQLDQRVQITAARRGEECIDDGVVPGEIHLADQGPHSHSTNPSPGATGELLARHR